MAIKTKDKWQYGDFQTPDRLAMKVVETLQQNHNLKPDIILEPSCGKGAFIRAALKGFSEANVLGFDINDTYVKHSLESLDQNSLSRTKICHADFFSTDWNDVLSSHKGELLILGNPPWVTTTPSTLN